MTQDLPPFFGLNIGKDKIKIAEVQLNNGKGILKAIGGVPSSVSLVSNESEEGETELSNEISKCGKFAGVTTKNCVVAISELSVYSRLLTLPKVNEDEVEEAIHYALKPLIPVPIDTVNISFIQIDEVKKPSGNMVNWYAVAAPKSLVERYMKIVEKAGFNLLAIETEALSITRMVSFSHKIPEEKNIMIIDIGAETTNMIIARNSAVIFTQSISTGSSSMTKIIASDFGIDDEQAEQYKIGYGLDFTAGEGKIAKSIEPIVQIILGETSRTLTYLRERIVGENITSIYLTGGGAALKGLDIYIKEKLGIDTVITNTLTDIEVDSNLLDRVKNTGGKEFNVAIGLALKTY